MAGGASNARGHRIVTVRMVVVSLVVGVALAVASVPVAAVLLVYGPVGSAPANNGYDLVDGQAVFIQEERFATAAVWRIESMPASFPDADIRGGGPGFSTGVGTIPEMSAMANLPGGRMWILRAGWPMHATTCFQIVDPPQTSTGVVGGLAMTVRGDFVVVPYVPLTLGMIANTAFYAALFFTPLAAVRLVRTRRRRTRGQCLACGYQLDDGMGVCSECGLAAGILSRGAAENAR